MLLNLGDNVAVGERDSRKAVKDLNEEYSRGLFDSLTLLLRLLPRSQRIFLKFFNRRAPRRMLFQCPSPKRKL